MANAKNNQNKHRTTFIKDIRVDIGPRQKRFRTRARGSSSLIEKKSCHIILILAESEKETPSRFKFVPKPKKLKKADKQGKSAKRKAEIKKEEGLKSTNEEKGRETKPKKFEGFKRMFRRKAI